MKAKGIDVSSYQKNINWANVAAAGVEFAILKIIRKDLQPDNRFEINWGGCRAAGLRVQGVYNYSYATTADKARTDAGRVLNILAGRKPMVWLDVEADCQKGLGERLIDIINTYGTVITGAGLQFGVYTGSDFYNNYIKPYAGKVQYPFWIARYPTGEKMNISRETEEKKCPVIAHELWGWQYSSKGSVPGINGDVDLNEWYAESGMNVNTANNTQKMEEYEMKIIKRGNKGSVVKVWQIIVGTTPDGKFGSKTEVATRAWQQKKGLVVDGVVGPKSWKTGLESL